MSSSQGRWSDRDAGRVVRPYALTRGRTRPQGAAFDLMATVAATGRAPSDVRRLSPEHREIIKLCRAPVPVADVAADLGVPLGVVRVLLGDLRDEGVITVINTPSTGQVREGVLRDVLNGLRAL
jgi:uncharacterized protein DUF742